jgi:hypothetical protein
MAWIPAILFVWGGALTAAAYFAGRKDGEDRTKRRWSIADRVRG